MEKLTGLDFDLDKLKKSLMRPLNGQSEDLIPISDNENEESPLRAMLFEEAKKLSEDLSEANNNNNININTNKRWEPKQLNPRHREIMRRLLEGSNYVTIAEQMGIHKQTVMLIAGSSIFKEELAKLEAAADFDIIKRADELSNEALDTLKILMRTARSEARRESAANSILDRAGYSKVEKKLVGVVNAEAVIRELNRRKAETLKQTSELNELNESKVTIAEVIQEEVNSL